MVTAWGIRTHQSRAPDVKKSKSVLQGAWRRLRTGVPLLAASVALALVVWFVITDSQNEVIEERLGFGLSVQAVGASSDVDTASRIPTALITISGRRDEVEEAQPEDFVARIDLGGLAAGTHQLPISVTSLNPEIRVRAVSPPSVDVTLEAIVQRVVPVRVLVSNPPPLGFEVSEPILSTPTVIVSGLQRRVDLVDSVVANVDVAGATVDVNLPVTVQPRTSSGAVAAEVQLEPATVTVLVPIEQAIFRREVAISPRLVGQVATGFRVLDVSVEPLTVVVVGSLEALEGADSASTRAVLLTGVRNDVERVVAVIPPEGLALESELTVRVQVSVEAITVRSLIDVPVEVINVPEGLRAIAQPDVVRITLRGDAPVIAAVDGSLITVTADAIGLEPGTFTVSVRVGFSGEVEVANVLPEEVSVTLTLASETSATNGEGAGQ
jgi:YbbR domain-containing protein